MDTNSAPVLLRHATAGDAEAVTELLEQLGYPNALADVRNRIHEMRGPDNAIFIAELNRRVVGLTSLHRIPFFHTNGFMARITAFVVESGYRRRGIGRALLEQVDAWAREKRCERIEVTSGDHRTAAHIFYQAYGYELDQRRFIRKSS